MAGGAALRSPPAEASPRRRGSDAELRLPAPSPSRRRLGSRARLAAALGGTMADGVDHIDIYADVGEEFNQVRAARGRGLSAPLLSLSRLRSRAACRALSAAAAPPPLFERSRRRRARGCAGPGGARPHARAAGSGSGPGQAESAPGAERRLLLAGWTRRGRAPSFLPSLFPSYPAFLPLCLSFSGAAPEGSPAPARRTGPCRTRRGERPLPAAGGGEPLLLFADESKSRRAVAVSRSRFAGEAELVRLFLQRWRKCSAFYIFFFPLFVVIFHFKK